MSVPFQKTVAIVDAMAFRRARVESFLKPWARRENAQLISLQPESAHERLKESGCDMLIYSGGTAHSSAREILAEIQVLHTHHPGAALVILSDDTSQLSIVAAMNSGAHGYLANSMAPGLALQALSFILHGGTYFPPAAILAEQTAATMAVAPFPQLDLPRDISSRQPLSRPAQQGQVSILSPEDQQQSSLYDAQVVCVQRRDSLASIQTGRAHPNTPARLLTERELAILCCLCRGDSNKVIARTCRIAESTVKIHLKSILRKIHVKNRTQAAIWAIQNGICTASDPSGLHATDNLFHDSPDLFLSEDQI